MTLMGIRTCDTCKKAAKALEAAGHKVTFHDMRADPLSDAQWQELLTEFGDKLVNKKSTTYRGLSDWMKASEADAQLTNHPTLMKRPVIRADGVLYLGWDDTVQGALLG
ncbi:arsenate reductase family protein [Oceaniglobus ichthyenteri]|uniref:arsenate reductase family protein n=1 Tax=Oceaniglobus ichthyenteri TaxID=2136177 RepID=UPI000D3C6F3D|nr:ArsC/Spx/MgsR family protein [Oceaniglobus ichthyenteri]